MDNLITELRGLTESIVARLQFTSYEELEDFVAERQRIIDELNRLKETTPFNVLEREQLEEILRADAVILMRMETLRNEASDWLQQRGQAKVQRNAYEAAYTPDSILMDRRE
ncbi:flagellar protein FliT [Paenibacillus sp. J22TS3]|uniref:flagellar protein FliT n=1 Tax=Paenibacillus sp. J22TS3 TaxID=2807192 RepID=UPI001B03FBDE|nr:flagellar protein FliT [Paenibacillus sp. J22TS3]GIP21744.1 hypothetical protein J22TS3_20190 [Paenibacillus sp. J22TS3]